LISIFFCFLFSVAWGEDPNPLELSNYEKPIGSRYSLLPHRGTYVLPITYNFTPHNDIYQPVTASLPEASKEDYYQNEEVEFQISFLLPVRRDLFWDWDLIMGYTHHSWWQLYNAAWSKPFRETIYQPEIFLRKLSTRKVGPFQLAGYDFSYVHESNGQISALSRSWDRLVGRVFFESGGTFLLLEGWVRIPDGKNDENPEILRYKGIGRIEATQTLGKHSLKIRAPLGSSYYGVEAQYSFATYGAYRVFVDWKSGYGYSLIEYDRSTQRIGVGLMLESFVDEESNPTKK